MKTLDRLIDEAMASGDWYGITIFAGRGDGPRVNLLRNVSTAQADQVTDPSIPASVRLRRIIEDNTTAADQADLFDDLLG